MNSILKARVRGGFPVWDRGSREQGSGRKEAPYGKGGEVSSIQILPTWSPNLFIFEHTRLTCVKFCNVKYDVKNMRAIIELQ